MRLSSLSIKVRSAVQDSWSRCASEVRDPVYGIVNVQIDSIHPSNFDRPLRYVGYNEE